MRHPRLIRAWCPFTMVEAAVRHASPSQLRGLHDLAVTHDAQILVISPEQRTAVGRALHGDVAASTVFTAPCAVAIATRRQVMATPRHIGIA